MTVESSTVISGPFIGNGVTVLFPRGFSIGDADHVTVTVDAVVITTGYTVLDPTLPTGDVQFAVAPASGEVIYLTRDTPITQETDYSTQGAVSPEQVEDDVDYRARVEQENRRDIDRSLKVALGEPGLSVTVGAVDTVPIWNVDGNLEEGPSTGAISSAQGYAIQTALDRTQTGLDRTQTGLDVIAVQDAKLIWQGAWSGATAYEINDAVEDDGSSYICTVAHTNQQPPNASYWDLLAAEGSGSSYATRTLLKAVVPIAGDTAYLAEGFRFGDFKFIAGDYSTEVAADTEEGIYLKADTIAATAGAWLRQYSFHPSVKWFGALGNDAAADLTALQAATDLVQSVFIPNGIYRTNAAWLMDDYCELHFESTAAEIKSTSATSIIAGRDPTVTRNYWLRMHGGTLRGNGSCDGVDLLSFTDAKIYNTWITACDEGLLNGGVGSVGAFYNEAHGATITTCTVGVRNGTLGNEFKMFGGRITDVVLGTDDDDNSGNSYYGVAVETFTLGGHRSSNSGSAAVTPRYIGSRLENPSITGIYASSFGFQINGTSQDTVVIAPGIISVAVPISDSGIRTQVLFAPTHNQYAGGTPFKTKKRITVNQAVASLAAGAVRQDSFALSGVADGDTIGVTLAVNWPSGLVASAPIASSGQVYLQLYNPTGGAISMAADDFHFEITDYT